MLNPFDLDATGLLIWGIVAHLIADWLLQNDWMAVNKARRHERRVPFLSDPGVGGWWDRHPAAYVHAGIHGLLLAVVFGWAAVPLAVVHLVIDTRTPLEWWSRLIRQTQPYGEWVSVRREPDHPRELYAPLYDVGVEVRFWADQVAHIACIAVAALLVGAFA